MTLETIERLYTDINKIKISIIKDVDFDYIQQEVSALSFYKDDLGRIISEILKSKTEIENIFNHKHFEYEVRAIDLLMTNSDVKKFSSEKERRNYIDYFLMKEDKKEIEDLNQQLSDLEKLLSLAKRKSKDLDEKYKWLKTQWEIVENELHMLKKQGSDAEYQDKVRDKINNDEQVKTVFSDDTVTELNNENKDKNINVSSSIDTSIVDILDLLNDL